MKANNRTKLTVGAVALAVVTGATLWLTAALAGPKPMAALATAPFAGALDALTTAPELHYRADVRGVGLVDADVTNFGQIIGSIAESGDTTQILQVGGKLYVKPSAAGLPGVTSPEQAAALEGKWLTGSTVQRLFSSVPGTLVPPAQLATRLASALGTTPPLDGRAEVDGVPVLGADTSLGVLYVSAQPPYRVVSLGSTSPNGQSSADAELTADIEPADGGMTFPVDPSSDGITNTDQQLEEQVQQLAANSVDPDLNFNIVGNGSVNCTDGACTVTVAVTSAISVNTAGAAITGGTVEATLTATITVDGAPAGGCVGEGGLPFGGTGTLDCVSPGAGAVFAAVDEEKKAQAQAESAAEGGAAVPYQIDLAGQFEVDARAQVNVSELEQQLMAQAKAEGELQNAYDSLLSGLQRIFRSTPAQWRSILSPEQLASGIENPNLRAAYVGTSIEKALAADPAVASNPDIVYLGASQPGSPVPDFRIYVGSKPIDIDVTGSSPGSLTSHLSRSYIQDGTQLLLYPSLTKGFLAEIYR
jgi:hypothetical protein